MHKEGLFLALWLFSIAQILGVSPEPASHLLLHARCARRRPIAASGMLARRLTAAGASGCTMSVTRHKLVTQLPPVFQINQGRPAGAQCTQSSHLGYDNSIVARVKTERRETNVWKGVFHPFALCSNSQTKPLIEFLLPTSMPTHSCLDNGSDR